MSDAKPSLLAGLMAKKNLTVPTSGVTIDAKANSPVQAKPPESTSQGLPAVAAESPKKSSILAGLAAGRPAAGGTQGENEGSKTPERRDSTAVVPTPSVGAAKPAGLLAGLASGREKAEALKAEHDYLFEEVPKDFKETLDRFDMIMQRDQGDIDFDLPHMRNYVMRIMVDLKENPEYDGLIIDRDVHNIIAFMRRLKGQAITIANEKTTKAQAKASKPKVGARFAMDFDNIDLMATKTPASLEDLSKIDFGDDL